MTPGLCYDGGMSPLILAVVFFAALAGFLWWNRSALHVAAAHRAFRRGDETAALDAFAKAEAGGRLTASATASYAYLALKNGRTEEAGTLLATALRRGRRGKGLKEGDRNLLETYQSLVLWKEGRLTEAVVLLERLLEGGYRTAALYGNLGYLLQEQGDLSRAEAVCREAVDWDDKGKVLLDNLASLYLRQGETEKAAEVYQRLLSLEPRFPEAWWGAGRVALGAADAAEARRCWEMALTLPFNALSTVERSAVEEALAALS